VTEFERVSKAALHALERGEIVALATVVRVRGSAPRHEGARMLIWPDGSIVGTVGGATLEERVIEHGLEALRQRRSRLESYLFSTEDDEQSIGLCGGAVEVHIEVLEPASTLYVIGAGHVAQKLAAMGHQLGLRVLVVDDRPEYASEERFPDADQIAVVKYDTETEQLGRLPFPITASCYVVVATWGWDEPALAQVLKADPLPAYVGLVSSHTKARVLKERVAKHGVSEQAWKLVRAPVGLDLGAETPGEIALSILAEIIQQARGASGRPMREKRPERKKAAKP
jgi:xanthine dehydrogenase accessory factor